MDEIKKILESCLADWGHGATMVCSIMRRIQKALELLKAEQPKHGHWIEQEGFDGDVYYDCSVCGESWVTVEGTPEDNGMIYCPHCGAKMDETKDGEQE